MLYLAPIFLLAGVYFYRRNVERKSKLLWLAVSMTLALGAFGYGLGKDLALRDNAMHASAAKI